MSGAPGPDPNRRQRGFALLTAVAVLAVVAMLAAGLGLALRREGDATHNLRDAAVARAHAEAGIAIAVEGLLVRNPLDRWPVDGTTRVLDFDGATISITAQDEAGKIDLNWAPVELIEGLLAEAGVDSALRSEIAAGILMRRHGARMPAAPPGEIMSGAVLGGPRLRDIGFGPFASADELLLVPGMTRAIYARIGPFVTVYAQSAHISVPTAPHAVLLSIPGMALKDADIVMAARANGTGGPPPSIPAGAERFAAALDTRAVTITAEAATRSGGRLVLLAVVALTGKPYQPVQFLEWRQEFGVSADSSADLAAAVLR